MSFYLDPKYLRYRVLAIDPGSSFFGVACYEMDAQTNQIVSLTATTWRADKLMDSSELDENQYPNRQLRRYRLRRELEQLLGTFQPSVVVYETPFFDRTKPLAFQALVEIMTMVIDTVTQSNPNIQFERIEPQAVKKALNIAGKKGKEVVQEAVELVPEIMQHFPEGLCDLDDNAIDAVAVGWSYVRQSS